MKKMTRYMVGLFFVLGALVSANAEMKTMGENPKFFEDDFDSPEFSEKNWIINLPRWDYIVIDAIAEPVDLGFRGRYILEDTTAIADGGIFYLSENLYIKTDLLTFYAEIFEPGHPRPKDQGGAVFIFDFFSDRYVAAQLFYSGDEWLHSAGYGGEGAGTEKTVLEFRGHDTELYNWISFPKLREHSLCMKGLIILKQIACSPIVEARNRPVPTTTDRACAAFSLVLTAAADTAIIAFSTNELCELWGHDTKILKFWELV